jgi:hypothetical protein
VKKANEAWFLALFARLLEAYTQHPLTPSQHAELHAEVWNALIRLYTKCPECVTPLKSKAGRALYSAFESACDRVRILKPNGNLEFDKIVPLPKERQMRTIQYKGSIYRLAGSADDAVEKIKKALSKAGYSPKKSTLDVKKDSRFSQEDSIMIAFYSVPEGTSGVDLQNAAHICNIHVVGNKWMVDGPAPESVKAEMFRNRGCPQFRKKTGSLDVVVNYIIAYFTKNIKELQG